LTYVKNSSWSFFTELKQYLGETFAIDLSKNASVKATNARGRAFSAKKAIDRLDIHTTMA